MSQENSPVTAAADAAGAAEEKVAPVVEDAKERAQEAASQAEDTVRDQAGTIQDKVAGGLGVAGEKVGSLADGEGVVSDLAGKASTGLKQASDWVAGHDTDEMITEAKSFAKRKPWVVALGGLAALFLASRMLPGRRKR